MDERAQRPAAPQHNILPNLLDCSHHHWVIKKWTSTSSRLKLAGLSSWSYWHLCRRGCLTKLKHSVVTMIPATVNKNITWNIEPVGMDGAIIGWFLSIGLYLRDPPVHHWLAWVPNPLPSRYTVIGIYPLCLCQWPSRFREEEHHIYDNCRAMISGTFTASELAHLLGTQLEWLTLDLVIVQRPLSELCLINFQGRYLYRGWP